MDWRSWKKTGTKGAEEAERRAEVRSIERDKKKHVVDFRGLSNFFLLYEK